MDKAYMQQYSQILEGQELKRKAFFDKIRNHSQREDVKEFYDKLYSDEYHRKADYEKNVIEKARIEKMRKEEELSYLKQHERERVRILLE